MILIKYKYGEIDFSGSLQQIRRRRPATPAGRSVNALAAAGDRGNKSIGTR